MKANHIESGIAASSTAARALAIALVLTVGCGDDNAAPGTGLDDSGASAADKDSGASASGDGDAVGDGDGDAVVNGDGDSVGDGDGDAGDGDDNVGDGDGPGNGDGDGDAVNDVDSTTEKRSTGCGKTQSGSGDYVKRTIKVGDLTRTYYLRIPTSYDKSKAYDLITRWHGSGGDGLSGGLGIEYAPGVDDNAIIVSADGINNAWSNTENDLALFDALLATTGSDYCIDLHRVFSYGFSAGAGFTSMLSCVRGDVLRGAAMVAGFNKSAGSQCKGKVAGWFLHDLNDDVVKIENGEAARDRLLTANGCSKETTDIGDGCKQYKGCAVGYPVVWCQTSGQGHDIRGDFAPAKVWSFFSGL